MVQKKRKRLSTVGRRALDCDYSERYDITEYISPFFPLDI